MNFQATVSSIAALGGIRPGSHITARPVTAIKAGPVAHSFRCAHRSVRHHERPLPWKASRLRDSSAGFCLEEAMGLRSGGSGVRRGTLTITGSNVRLGTEMPVALSSFSL